MKKMILLFLTILSITTVALERPLYDSVIVEVNDDYYGKIRTKRIYGYNTAGNITEYLQQRSEGWSDEWENVDRYENSYDNQQRVIDHKYYEWNRFNDVWNTKYRRETIYNEQGDVEVRDYSGYDGDKWRGTTTVSPQYTYNEKGQVIVVQQFLWNDTTFSWETWIQSDSTFGSNGNLLRAYTIKKNRSTTPWSPSSYIEQQYNDSGQLLLDQSGLWSDDSSSFFATSSRVYVYDTENRLLSNILYLQDSITVSPYINSKYICEYGSDSLGTTKTVTQASYSSSRDSLVYSSRVIETYNSAQDRILYKKFTWVEDSVRWDQTEQVEYSYSESELITETKTTWKEVRDDYWSLNRKTEIHYLADSNTTNLRDTLTLNYKWSSVTDSWNETSYKRYKYELDYDSLGRQLLYAKYYWDENGNTWKGSSKFVNEYDDKGNNTFTATYTWSSYYWTEYSSNTRTYDDSARALTILDHYNGSRTKEAYEYDSLGHRTLYERYTWDTSLLQWRGDTKTVKVYDGNNHLICNEGYSWESVGAWDWYLASFDSSYFDVKDSLIKEKSMYYDLSSESWYSGSLKEWEYDSVGNLAMRSSYGWNSDDQEWYGYWKLDYTYNQFNDILTEKEYDWDFDTSNPDWFLKYDYKYSYYYDAITSVEAIEPMVKEGNSLIVAPTPTKDSGKLLVVSDESGEAFFTIFNDSGKKIAMMKHDLEVNVYDSFSFDIIQKLPKGVYFIEMKVNGKMKAISKLVKIEP